MTKTTLSESTQSPSLKLEARPQTPLGAALDSWMDQEVTPLPNADELIAWRNKVRKVDASLRTLREAPIETKRGPRIGWTRPQVSTSRLTRAFHVPGAIIGSATNLTPEQFTSSAA